jgi:hypothetical protein
MAGAFIAGAEAPMGLVQHAIGRRCTGPAIGATICVLVSAAATACRTDDELGETAAGICLDQGGGSNAVVRTNGGCRQVELVAIRSFQRSQSFDASLSLGTPLRFAVPSSIPVVVGNAGNHDAHLVFTPATGADVDCLYRGGSSQSHPTTPADLQAGRTYLFVSCTNGMHAGDAALATKMSFRVDGDDRDPARVIVGRLLIDELACGNQDAGVDRDAGADQDAGADVFEADASREADASETDAVDADGGQEASDAADGDGPRSLRCGDGIRDPVLEECDLGSSLPGRAVCTSDCRVRDLLALPAISDAVSPPGRMLGEGRHPVSVGASGAFAIVFTEPETSPLRLSLTTVDSAGIASDVALAVSTDTTPLLISHPVVAAVPDGRFAVAFTDFNADGDELGVALRLVDPSAGKLGALVHANASTAFSQYDADIVATSSGLVVAWLDDSSAATAPDVKYRTFDFELRPTSGELDLASSAANEGDVALVAWQSGWAAAWRSGDNGLETLHARAGSIEWSIGPFLPGPVGSRPALAEIDSTHLLVVFAEGTDASADAGSSSKLRAAVLDSAAPGIVSAVDVPALVPAFVGRTQDQPNAARVGQRLFVAWRSPAEPGEAQGDELWLKQIVWNGTMLLLDSIEIPLPRSTAHRAGDQRRPALAAGPLLPIGDQLVTAFDDLGHTFGSGEGNGDVAVEAIPVPLVRVGSGP